MAQTVVSMNCPKCGAPVTTDQKKCEYCDSPIIISTFNSVYDMPMPQVNKAAGTYRQALAENPDHQGLNNSLAMCYLKLKLYDKALPVFEKAMEDNFDNSETFFYAAICLLKGQKAFLHQRPTINKILEYINAALMIEPKGIYYYFLAYIKYDYFQRKFLITSPNYREVLNTAIGAGLSQHDVNRLYAILGVPKPDVL
ncbi:MAG: tetratricopeptide repeat protein [Ruminococcaceae bacterium]|nr:tetratricopeptide repeat protein [Oscillospiraceae bacterium]MBE6715151.1 tetratricopeptide repeat protein [Oscillospiraceae bacterium]